jgi:hypothetical protein
MNARWSVFRRLHCPADGRALIVHASRLARHTAGLADGTPFDALVHEPVTADGARVSGLLAARLAARRAAARMLSDALNA